MNTRQIRLNFRDAVNKITGKQALIEEYNILTLQLCNISDNTPVGTPMKNYLMEQLDVILERQDIYTRNGIIMDSYDPYEGRKSTTQKKINDMRTLLQTIKQVPNVR